jgi:hypothetical protein
MYCYENICFEILQDSICEVFTNCLKTWCQPPSLLKSAAKFALEILCTIAQLKISFFETGSVFIVKVDMGNDRKLLADTHVYVYRYISVKQCKVFLSGYALGNRRAKSSCVVHTLPLYLGHHCLPWPYQDVGASW